MVRLSSDSGLHLVRTYARNARTTSPQCHRDSTDDIPTWASNTPLQSLPSGVHTPTTRAEDGGLGCGFCLTVILSYFTYQKSRNDYCFSLFPWGRDNTGRSLGLPPFNYVQRVLSLTRNRIPGAWSLSDVQNRRGACRPLAFG